MIIKAYIHCYSGLFGIVSTEVAAADASILGSGLTANGADPSGSADGMIPAYTGGISKPPADYVAGGDHIDPFAADNRSSASRLRIWGEYSNRLSAGQKALLARKKAIIAWISIRRAASCALPQFVYDETKKNVERARLLMTATAWLMRASVCRFQ